MSALEHLARTDFADLAVADAVHRALTRRNDLHPALAGNPHLSASSWGLLYSPKTPTPVAKLLVGRTLDDDRLRHVCASESRDSVLASCIAANHVTDEVVALIPARRRRARTAAAIAACGSVSPDLRVALVGQLGLIDRLILAGDPSVSDDDTTVASWFPNAVLDQPVRSKSLRSAAYALLLHHRPALVSLLIASGNASAVIAAAASPVVDGSDTSLVDAVMALRNDDRRYALMAYSANPRTCVSTLRQLLGDQRLQPSEIEQLSETLHRRRNDIVVTGSYHDVDRATLDRLLRRALPSEYRPEGRPAELLALAGNPALGEDAGRVLDALCSLRHHVVWGPTVASFLTGVATPDSVLPGEDTVGYQWVPDQPIIDRLSDYQPALLPPWLFAAFTLVAVEALGDDGNAWESLVSLFDAFTGSARDLIDVAASL